MPDAPNIELRFAVDGNALPRLDSVREIVERITGGRCRCWKPTDPGHQLDCPQNDRRRRRQ